MTPEKVMSEIKGAECTGVGVVLTSQMWWRVIESDHGLESAPVSSVWLHLLWLTLPYSSLF